MGAVEDGEGKREPVRRAACGGWMASARTHSRFLALWRRGGASSYRLFVAFATVRSVSEREGVFVVGVIVS